MARANFVKKAQKDNPAVKKGESYYWWKFPYGSKQYSKTRPKRSQLTQSDFFGQMYAFEDEDIDDLSNCKDADDLRSAVEEIASNIRVLGEEQEEKLNNMPEGLQSGPTGELLQSRYDECEMMADELEDIDLDDYDGVEVKDANNPPEEFTEWLENKIDELQGICYNGE